MNSALKRTFERQITLIQDFEFEDFIKDLLLIRHGASGFIPTRPKKDRGCDGIIVGSSTVIACYGPVNYDAKKFAIKAGDDHAQYVLHWKDRYPNWQFIFNSKLGPDAITTITDLHKGSVPWGVDNIMSIIVNEFDGTQRIKVAELLGIPRNQVCQDYLEEILENLLKKTVTNPDEILDFKKANLIDFTEKVKINYDAEDVEIAIQEYENIIEEIFQTGAIFQRFDDDEKDRIILRVQQDYKNANGSFKERLKIISDNYLRQYSNISDDIYRYNITVVLLYIFEQCKIGNKVRKS